MQPNTVSLVRVKMLWQEGVFYPCGELMAVPCSDIVESRDVWLIPTGHCGPSDQFELSYVASDDPAALTGLFIRTPGIPGYVADVLPGPDGSAASTLAIICRNCCGGTAPTGGPGDAPPTEFALLVAELPSVTTGSNVPAKYNGVFPEGVFPVAAGYDFTRQDNGTISAYQKAALDYWYQYIPNTFQRIEHDGGVGVIGDTLYTFQAYQAPAFLASDTKRNDFYSNIIGNLPGSSQYEFTVSINGADVPPPVAGATLDDIVTQLNAGAGPYAEYGSWQKVTAFNQIRLQATDAVTSAALVLSIQALYTASSNAIVAQPASSCMPYGFYLVDGATTQPLVVGTDKTIGTLLTAINADATYSAYGTFTQVSNNIQVTSTTNGLVLHVMNTFVGATETNTAAGSHYTMTAVINGVSHGPYLSYNGTIIAGTLNTMDHVLPYDAFDYCVVSGSTSAMTYRADATTAVMTSSSAVGTPTFLSNVVGDPAEGQSFTLNGTVNGDAFAQLNGVSISGLISSANAAAPWNTFGIWSQQAGVNGLILTPLNSTPSMIQASLILAIVGP